MEDRTELSSNLDRVAALATASRVSRLLANPARYLSAQWHRHWTYRLTGRERTVIARTFFDRPMQVNLPAGTDIFLTGGKSHDSEIRLARYLIRHLSPAGVFCDVGAHYGYFSLLAATLVGPLGKVVACEPAPDTFLVLQANTAGHPTVETRNIAVSDKPERLTFFQFPNLYSEYNTLHPEQFAGEEWFARQQPVEVEVAGHPLDDLWPEGGPTPDIVKIDVEGAEDRVIRGMSRLLSGSAPAVILEFLCDERDNSHHRIAEELLRSAGYLPHRIDETGGTVPLASVTDHLAGTGAESDNIVFLREPA